MARIAGVDVPNNKQVRIGLTYIFGIGDSRAAKILTEADIDPLAKVGTLDEDAAQPHPSGHRSSRARSKAISARKSRSTSSA